MGMRFNVAEYILIEYTFCKLSIAINNNSALVIYTPMRNYIIILLPHQHQKRILWQAWRSPASLLAHKAYGCHEIDHLKESFLILSKV